MEGWLISMRKYLLSVLLVLWTASAWAFPPVFIGAITQGLTEAPAYLFSENFDATGSQLSWTITGTAYTLDGTPGLNSTTQKAVLDGITQVGAVKISYDLGQEYTELWVKAIVRQTSATEAFVLFMQLTNDAATTLSKITWYGDPTPLRVHYGGTEYDGGIINPTLNTEYCVYLHFKIQTAGGNDGVSEFYIDDTAPYTRPASPDGGLSNGNLLTAGDGARYLNFYADADTTIEVDEIYGSTSPID